MINKGTVGNRNLKWWGATHKPNILRKKDDRFKMDNEIKNFCKIVWLLSLINLKLKKVLIEIRIKRTKVENDKIGKKNSFEEDTIVP